MDYPVKTQAIKTAFSGPGIALMSSFIALGALFSDSGFTMAQAVVFSLIGYALPGQLVVAEMVAGGAAVVAITVAVFLVNARLLPMTVVIISTLLAADNNRPAAAADYARAHLIAVTSWVCFNDTYERVPPAHLRVFFTLMATTLWLCAAAASAIGFIAGERLPHQWLVALLFLNPIYFLCAMLRSIKRRMDIAAFFLGIAALPIAHQFFPDWDIVIVGVVGGGVCFLYFQRRDAKSA